MKPATIHEGEHMPSSHCGPRHTQKSISGRFLRKLTGSIMDQDQLGLRLGPREFTPPKAQIKNA